MDTLEKQHGNIHFVLSLVVFLGNYLYMIIQGFPEILENGHGHGKVIEHEILAISHGIL